MSTLAEYLNLVVSTLENDDNSRRVQVLETETFSQDQFAVKVRATLADGSTLQVRLYANQDHIDYAYQLIENNQPILRWDNKEHFTNINSSPHHFHTSNGEVKASPLNGEIADDLLFVLNHLVTRKS